MADAHKKAPLDMVSEFLKAVKRKNYESALKLSNDILIYEPNNSIILSYKPILSKMVEEDKNPGEVENTDTSEESTDEETDESEDEETDEGD